MHRRLSRGRAFTLLAAAALALGAAACSGSGWTRPWHKDRATGRAHPGQPRAGSRGRHVWSRRSSDAPVGRSASSAKPVAGPESAYDKGTIADVQPARSNSPKVAARAYDTVGLEVSGPAAPFLIDDQTLERRVLRASSRPMLPALAGLAWWGWRCCRPICASRWACRIRWLRSRTTGVPDRRPGGRAGQGDVRRSWRHPVGMSPAGR